MRAGPTTNPVIHAIEATAGVAEARDALKRPGVAWLAVCHEGVLVGTIDEDALRAADDAATCIGALAARGCVRWLG